MVVSGNRQNFVPRNSDTGGKKVPDPGSGSATLSLIENSWVELLGFLFTCSNLEEIVESNDAPGERDLLCEVAGEEGKVHRQRPVLALSKKVAKFKKGPSAATIPCPVQEKWQNLSFGLLAVTEFVWPYHRVLTPPPSPHSSRGRECRWK
jgi:hypothetical protein